jgi:hypothetical protein
VSAAFVILCLIGVAGFLSVHLWLGAAAGSVFTGFLAAEIWFARKRW